MASASQKLKDPSTTAAEKASEGVAVGAEVAATAIASAVASPVAGKVVGGAVGKMARTKNGKKILIALLLLSLLPAVSVVGGLAMVVVGAVSVMMADEESQATNEPGGGTCDVTVLPGSGQAVTSLTAEQAANASTLIRTTIDVRGLEPRDAVIVIMTALTESSLINVNYGDKVGPDSRGLFQQRDSWGTLEQRMDPATATGLFLNSMTSDNLRVYGTTTPVNAMPGSRYEVSPWIVAQSVQRSAFADGSNYEKHYFKALAIVSEVTGIAQGTITDGGNWSAGGSSGLIPGVTDSVTCETTPGAGSGDYGDATGPGAWGGHANGRIPDEFMCPVAYAPAVSLRCDAARSLEAMSSAYAAVFGAQISITDGYRTYDDQVRLKLEKPALAGIPGTSNHGWGLALDLGGGINGWGTPQRAWMVAHAPSFGWFSPRWAQPGGKPEPWHWEFGDSGF